ncbi:hypothetical protein DNH61_12425 [Paenibacillus sambharensis]|uniref:GAF domain-containing protein n=1 Tax=Paenibacillus sambharensis TaxID=1803190 RepID=A0A2W1L8V3_9BACL|nr:GAF domain-containing protein [Paenibacillus sambharensis]PZD95343.1 hypothetical protein DNH61_12425 [Paenibacillus sambharensis]
MKPIAELKRSKRFAAAASNVLAILQETMGLNTIFIAVNDQMINIIIKASNRDEIMIKEGAELAFEETYCKLVTGNGRFPTIIPDTGSDPLTGVLNVTSVLGSCSFVGIPLSVGENGPAVGTICAMDRRAGAVKDKDIQMLQQAGELLSRLIEYELNGQPEI